MMETGISFSAESHTGKMLEAWWQGLQDRPGFKGDKATRAVLRRCATITDVSLSDAYQQFYRYMLATNAWKPDTHAVQNDKLAAIAGLLSHVEKQDALPLSVKMSELSGDKPLVSELRFRSILKVDTTDDLYVALRRVLPMIDHQANILQLAESVFYWNDTTKKKWAYSYRWPTKTSI